MVSGKYKIRVLKTAKEVCGCGDIIVLTVKPKQVPEVFPKGLNFRGKILVSIVANLMIEISEGMCQTPRS